MVPLYDMSALDISPSIIPRPEHPVSRKLLSPNAIKVLHRLRDQGFTAYLVGGCVRDLWLGREPKDFDVVTDATPAQLKRIFRNCRLIGRRFRLAHLHFKDEIIEVATFRALTPEEPEVGAQEQPESEEDHSPVPRVVRDEEGMIVSDNVFGTPAEDAVRRDFTVNALFYDVGDFSLIDYVGGVEDLKACVIRTIGDPRVRISEDPVRMIRAVRFAAMLGFTMDEETWEATLEMCRTITRAAPPRLYEEVLKLFLMGEGEACYQLLRRTGLFAALFSRFNDWLDTEAEGFPHTVVSRAFEIIDERAQEEKVSPELFFALVFGEYIEEWAAALQKDGLPPTQATHQAVSDFFADLAPVVFVPNKVVMGVRDILGFQHRLRKTPGRHADAFAARPGFRAAFDYLRFKAERFAEAKKLLAWWERYLSLNPTALPADGLSSEDERPPTGEGAKKRKRRYRRGRNRENQ